MQNRRCALIACHILTAGFGAVFLSLMILSALEGLVPMGKLLLYSATPFLLVSLLRRFIAAKRPYQGSEAAAEEAPHHGANDSFPSRHSYSAFFISTLAFRITPGFSYCLFPAAILLALLRVLCGAHYPRDVVAGAFLGVLFAVVALVFLG